MDVFTQDAPGHSHQSSGEMSIVARAAAPVGWAVRGLSRLRLPSPMVCSASKTHVCARALSSAPGGDPLKDPAIAAAIERERAAREAVKPVKLGRSLTETLHDHRDELFNIFLAALLVVLTLKMLREKVPC